MLNIVKSSLDNLDFRWYNHYNNFSKKINGVSKNDNFIIFVKDRTDNDTLKTVVEDNKKDKKFTLHLNADVTQDANVNIYLPSNMGNITANGTGNIRLGLVSNQLSLYGDYVIDENGIMKSGVIIRHLILPNNLENTKGVIDWVKNNFNEGEVLFSLMSQFTPISPCPHRELSRRLTQEEYDEIEDYLFDSGIEDGFMQELSSAKEEYIPPFDLTGV